MVTRSISNMDGELLTIKQVAELSNLGISKTREIAKESKAIRKIGRCCRINKKVFFDYLEKEFSD